MTIPTGVPILPGLAPLAADYDGVILDVWGVMHQGGAAYPAALACLRRLRAAGKRVVFLSNAPRLAAQVEAGLNGKGVDAALYDGVVASGDAARAGPRRPVRVRRPTGSAAATACSGRPARTTCSTGSATAPPTTWRRPTSCSASASTTAARASRITRRSLGAAAGRGLPMVCVNPDLLVIRLGAAGALRRRARRPLRGDRRARTLFRQAPPGGLRAGPDGARPPPCARARGRRRARHRHRRRRRRRPRFAADRGRPARRDAGAGSRRGAGRPGVGRRLPGRRRQTARGPPGVRLVGAEFPVAPSRHCYWRTPDARPIVFDMSTAASAAAPQPPRLQDARSQRLPGC